MTNNIEWTVYEATATDRAILFDRPESSYAKTKLYMQSNPFTFCRAGLSNVQVDQSIII
jgi:hypothetical protein